MKLDARIENARRLLKRGDLEQFQERLRSWSKESWTLRVDPIPLCRQGYRIASPGSVNIISCDGCSARLDLSAISSDLSEAACTTC
jgi:hypothetical protein